MRVRWCNGRVEMAVRHQHCPDWSVDHMHLICPTCTYHTVCAPLGEKS